MDLERGQPALDRDRQRPGMPTKELEDGWHQQHGGVIAGAYYLAIGYLLANNAIQRTAPAAVQLA